MDNALVPQSPYAAAAAQAVAVALAPMQGQIDGYMSRFEQMLANLCAQGAVNAQNGQQTATQNSSGQSLASIALQRVVPGAGGGCNSCGGGCANGQCGMSYTGGGGGGPALYGNGRPNGPMPIPMQPGGPPLMVVPGCYSECDGIDPCLYQFLLEARKRFDEWSWMELMKREIEIVHLDTNVGDGANYQVPAQPLAANQSAILVQNAAQQLPWQPGLIKLNADWTGTKAPSLVTINFWSGVAGITGITDPTTNGLIQIGSSYKLSDFECADDCYLAPWPKLFGCGTNAIPDTRRVYVELRVGAVGAATLSSFSVTVLKKQTAQCNKYTGIYKGKCS